MSMAAEIIRTEKTSWGGIKYVVKCQYCGGETTRYNRNGRNATCVKCSKKNDRERAERRKLEREREIYNKAIDDVLGGMQQITYNISDADELFEKICDLAEELKGEWEE